MKTKIKMIIPEELKQIDHWITWQSEPVIDNKTNKQKVDKETGELVFTKVPYQLNGKRASATDKNTWTSYENITKTTDKIAFVLTEDVPYTCIDLDDCIVNGVVNEQAQKIVDYFDSFTEISQSGQGLHIFMKGKKPGPKCKNTKLGIEIYDSKRFICMTGNQLEGTPGSISYNQEKINYVYDSIFQSNKEPKNNKETNQSSPQMSDNEVIKLATNAKNGNRFRELFAGNVSLNNDDHSSADLALCNILAFYTQDKEQIDRIFCMSGLYREKWDRQDYKDWTINNAINSLTNTYKSKPSYQMNFNEELEIPLPFFERNNELYYEKENVKKDIVEVEHIYVSRQIPFITKELHNIEFPQVFYQLEWDSRIGKVEEVVPASTIQDTTKLIDLSEKGMSVNSINRSTLVKYFDSYIRVNKNKIKLQKAVERLGYVKGHFIHPITSKDIEIIALDEGEKQMMEAFEMKGSVEGWKEKIFDEIKDQPKALFMVLASLSSILLSDLKVDPFIVEITSSTSQGKTTMLNIASTVWGSTKLVNEWNTTQVGLERKTSFLNSFPLFMDDTRKADKDIIKNTVYHFSGGRSKGRATLQGTKKEYTWSNIMLSTGETKMTEIETTAGGVAARIISLSGQPLRNDYEMVTRLEKEMEEHQGFVGVEFQQVWEKEKKQLMEHFPRFEKMYRSMSKDNEALGRISQYYAVVHFAGSILKGKLGFEFDLEQLVDLYEEMAQTNKAIDKPMQFIEEILIDLDSDRKSIYYRGGYEPQYETKAYFNNGQLWLAIAYVNKFLGMESRLIRDEWLEREITVSSVRNGRKIDNRQIKIDGKAPKAIPLNMDVVKELDFDFTETKSNHR